MNLQPMKTHRIAACLFVLCLMAVRKAPIAFGADPGPLANLFADGEPKSVDVVYLSEQGWPVYQNVSAQQGLQIINSFATQTFNWQPAKLDAPGEAAPAPTPLAAITWTNPSGKVDRINLYRDGNGNWTTLVMFT